jgi:hypothetical protein
MSIGILIIASIGLISWSYVIYIGISRMIDYKIKKSLYQNTAEYKYIKD